jgi:hypothetical protein
MRTKEEALELQRKGGSTKSLLRNESLKWVQIKKRMERDALSPDDMEWMIHTFENRDAFGFETLQDFNKLYDKLPVEKQSNLIRVKLDIGKFIHGEKIKTENLNVNVNMEFDEWRKRLRDSDGDEEGSEEILQSDVQL